MVRVRHKHQVEHAERVEKQRAEALAAAKKTHRAVRKATTNRDAPPHEYPEPYVADVSVEVQTYEARQVEGEPIVVADGIVAMPGTWILEGDDTFVVHDDDFRKFWERVE
jgi:hypothetical protein